MKEIINRALFQFGVGVFFGSAFGQADMLGIALLLVGFLFGFAVFSK